MGKSPFKKATIIFCFAMALMASGWGHAEAQVPDFGLGSIVPFKSLQTFFGPLFPATCIGDTFRSEFGMGVSTPLFDRITLSGFKDTSRQSCFFKSSEQCAYHASRPYKHSGLGAHSYVPIAGWWACNIRFFRKVSGVAFCRESRLFDF